MIVESMEQQICHSVVDNKPVLNRVRHATCTWAVQTLIPLTCSTLNRVCNCRESEIF